VHKFGLDLHRELAGTRSRLIAPMAEDWPMVRRQYRLHGRWRTARANTGGGRSEVCHAGELRIVAMLPGPGGRGVVHKYRRTAGSPKMEGLST